MNEVNVKNRLNIVGTGYLKTNKSGGNIISFLPDVPIKAYLDDLLFILTVPDSNEKFAPAYCRLQDKFFMGKETKREEVFDIDEIKVTGFCREKQNKIIICAPDIHILVDLDKIVIIGTVPFDNKKIAPFYIRRKIYKKSRSELETKQDSQQL